MFEAKIAESMLSSAFNDLLTNSDLLTCLEHAKYLYLNRGEYLDKDKIHLVLIGSISAINCYGEVVQISYEGLVNLCRLSFIQQHYEWHDYKLRCNTSVSILSIDPLYCSKLINNYPLLNNNFYEQAVKLDLLLLHFFATVDTLVNRINLSSYISELEQLFIYPGIFNSSFFDKYDFLIMYSGNLLHTKRELELGQVYVCKDLPQDNEWFSLGHTCLFAHKNVECSRFEEQKFVPDGAIIYLSSEKSVLQKFSDTLFGFNLNFNFKVLSMLKRIKVFLNTIF